MNTESKTMPEAYDYSQLSASVSTALRGHIQSAVKSGTPFEDAAVLASIAAMAGPIGTMAQVMGREMPNEDQVKQITDSLLAKLAELPASQDKGGKDASP